jgi:hypothetical protein
MHGIGRKWQSQQYRWPGEFRDDVLARLLQISRLYGEAYHLSGATVQKVGKKMEED